MQSLIQDLIQEHSVQQEYISRIDEVLRKGSLTTSDLATILSMTNSEIFRKEILRQKAYNLSLTSTNGTTTTNTQ